MTLPFRSQSSLLFWIPIAALAGTAPAQTAGEALESPVDRVHHDADADGGVLAERRRADTDARAP